MIAFIIERFLCTHYIGCIGGDLEDTHFIFLLIDYFY